MNLNVVMAGQPVAVVPVGAAAVLLVDSIRHDPVSIVDGAVSVRLATLGGVAALIGYSDGRHDYGAAALDPGDD